ncbi:MAG: S8 family serine peptidase [Chloroflexota bacterium]|nr:S8 family serine peptidase [Chloroflexota bacterium]
MASVDSRKLQPKLRMVRNASTTVNAIRAEQSAALQVTNGQVVSALKPMRGAGATPMERHELGPVTMEEAAPTTPDVVVDVFVELTSSREETPSSLKEFSTRRRTGVVTAQVPLAKLNDLMASGQVAHVALGEPLTPPRPDQPPRAASKPTPRIRRFGTMGQHRGGVGVLIGLIDVGGFDFAHPDFLDAQGKTRFYRIWDQGGDVRPPPAGFTYGAEFTDAHLNRALAVAADPTGPRLPATQLEPQSQMSEGAHATHVASIAAGKYGLCPNATIAGVLVSLPTEDQDRRRSFYDSTRLAHAIDYLLSIGRELGEAQGMESVPVSINISLGTNGHAHDSTSAISRWIDTAVGIPGRCVCVAAGNAGQEVAEFEGDIGFAMGRIHTSGQIAARGLIQDIDWVVVGNGLLDLSENELEIWYGSQDRFAVNVQPPGEEWTGWVEPGEFIENRRLADGSMVSIYNELHHPINGANSIAIYLSPFLDPKGIIGVRAGTWTVRLRGKEVRDGHYHGWIERDDPRPLGRVGLREAWSFPSYFAEGSYVDNSSVGSLACGRWVVTVANLDEANEAISRSSSQGPTRDGRFKPDVAAPGTNVVAAKGFAAKGDEWVAMSGTSMASPYVAGVAGLMLAINPSLTAAQIGGIIQGTAQPLPGKGYAWMNDAGFGVIDPEACLHEAALATRPPRDRTKARATSRREG